MEGRALGNFRHALLGNPHIGERQFGKRLQCLAVALLTGLQKSSPCRRLLAIVLEEGDFLHLKHMGKLLEAVTQLSIGIDTPVLIGGHDIHRIITAHLTDVNHQVGADGFFAPVELRGNQSWMEFILATVAARQVAEHHGIVTSTEGVNSLGQFLAERLVCSHENADFSTGWQSGKLIMRHDAANHPRRRQFLKREVLVIGCLEVDVNGASAVTTQRKQGLVGFNLTIPFLILAAHHIQQDAVHHHIGHLLGAVNHLGH